MGFFLDNTNADEYLLKILMICFPDEVLTKSLRSYAGGVSEPKQRLAFGVDIPTKTIKMDNNVIRLLLAYISTNPVFGPPRPSLFRGSSAAVFAFSKSNRSYMTSTKSMFHEFRRHIPHPAVPIAFIGLHSDSEVVTIVEGQELAQELGVDYYEMEADDLQTLDAVLRSLVQKILTK